MATQKTAKWSDSSNGWMCSCCNRDSMHAYKTCPKCGCMMRNGYVTNPEGEILRGTK